MGQKGHNECVKHRTWKKTAATISEEIRRELQT
jgi:hypothetical protein